MGIFLVKKTVLAAAVVLAFASVPVFALDVPVARIADDSRLRATARDAWLSASPARAASIPRSVHQLDGGGTVEIRGVSRPGELLVLFARRGPDGRTFPGWAQGSWEFARRADTGAISNVRVFPRSDPNTFVQFRPFGDDRVWMDVLIYDAYVVRNLALAVSMERLSTMPLNDLLALAGSRFPVRYFEPDPDDFRDSRLFVANVRQRLPELSFADDGAIDQNGNFVRIDGGTEQSGVPGLNCSGFAKWTIDGILRPVTGGRMPIAPLAAPFGDRGSSFTEHFEPTHDPFFGLDWIRNLASEAGRVLRSAALGELDEIEVRRQPFSQLIVRSGRESSVRPFPAFHENAGHGIEGIIPMLYALAIDEPGRFFLAAISNDENAPTTADNPRGRPAMRLFFHIAVLVPHFDENGIFRVAVFESAEETSIAAFRNRYAAGHHVSLVRVPVETALDP